VCGDIGTELRNTYFCYPTRTQQL